MRDEPLHPRYRKRATDREKQLGRRYQLVAINTKVGQIDWRDARHRWHVHVENDVKQAMNDVAALLPPRLQRFRPALEDEARDLLSSGVHAVLTSDRFSLLTETALTSVQTQLLAGQPVRFTLGQAKARIP